MKGTTAKSSRRSKRYVTRAEKFIHLDSLYKRVQMLRYKVGLKGDGKAHISFELALHKFPLEERRKILKDIFSPDGRDIKLEHEPHIEMLETFLKKVLEL
jgi:hypothetical protein